jgi:hypothetical protein
MPVPILTANHEGVKFLTIRRQPCCFALEHGGGGGNGNDEAPPCCCFEQGADASLGASAADMWRGDCKTLVFLIIHRRRRGNYLIQQKRKLKRKN